MGYGLCLKILLICGKLLVLDAQFLPLNSPCSDFILELIKMHYTTNILDVSPQVAYNCAYSALMSFEKPTNKTDSSSKATIIPSLLTVQATVKYIFVNDIVCVLTVQPMNDTRCCLHVYADMTISDGSESYSYLFLAAFLERFSGFLTQSNA